MLNAQPIPYKNLLISGGIVALMALVAFIFSGNAITLAAPFAFLYLILLTLNWKAGFYILLASIPFSVTYELLPQTLSTTVPDEPMMWIFTLITALVIAQNPMKLPEWWWRSSITLIISLQLICLILSVIYSSVPFLSFKFLLSKLWMLACFFVLPVWIFTKKKDLSNAFKILLITLTITVIFVIVRHAGLGFTFLGVNKACSIFYYNHVEYGAVLSVFIPLLFIAFRIIKQEKKAARTKLILLSLVILFFLIALFLTYARSAILGVVFALIVALAIRMKLVNLILPTFYALIILLVVHLTLDNNFFNYRPNYDQTYMRKDFKSHIQATLQGQDLSSMERVYRWLAAAKMSTVHPITGFGPHSFTKHYRSYTVHEFRTYVSENTEQSTTHNYFLYMLVEQGWPAMILYGLLNLVAFAKAQRVYHRSKDRYYKLATLGVAMMLAVNFVNNFFSEFIETHKVGALFFLPLCLLVILDHRSRTESTTDTAQDQLS